VPVFCQQLDEQRIASRESTRIVFIHLIKLLLAFSPLMLATQWYLTTTADRYTQAVASAEAAHHVLIENHSALESLRDRLSSPQRIRNMAAEKLSLHSPAQGQIEIF
jgi:predicted aminopeptidase